METERISKTKWIKLSVIKMSYLQKQNIINQLHIFAKAQLSAFLGGLTDYLTMIIMVEVFFQHYGLGIFIGGLLGACINFMINKFWTFENKPTNTFNQILKFSGVVLGSIFLKFSGTYIFTEWMQWDYKVARIVADAFVCFGFNYVLQKMWVFR